MACAWASATPAGAQTKPKRRVAPLRPAATRPVPVPKVNLSPRVLITPSKKPLPSAQLEEALRLLLRADSVQQARVQPGMEAEAEGFVLDQTVTKPGRDFYELFFSTFQGTTGLGDYTIVLSERPARGTSSLIAMSVNDTELLEMPLPTRTELLEEAVVAAVATAQDFLGEQLAQSKQLETTHPTSPPGGKP